MTDSPFRPVGSLRTTLGEGPIWDADRQCLRLTDIPERRIWTLDPENGAARAQDMPEEVGCFAPSRAGGLIAAMRSKIAAFDAAGGETLLACNPAPHVGRFNDGIIDPKGRLLVGTLDAEKQGRAALYRYDRRGLVRLAGGLMTSNGLAFSPDGKVLYHSDTSRFVIHAYDYDVERGEISAARVFARLTPTATDRGRPDGAAVDAEGCYWSALFQGARIARFAPTGALLAEFPLPAPSPTMPCFGGPDNRTLFVTTAGGDPDSAEHARWQLSGRVFAMRVDVPGLVKPDFDPEA